MSKMIFKTSEIPEEMELDLNGELLKFTYRKLSDSETKEIEKEVIKIQKRDAKDQKILNKAEKKIKNGASLENVLKDLKDDKFIEFITVVYKIEELSKDRIENGEELIDLNVKLSDMIDSMFKAEKFIDKVLSKQFSGTNKKEIVEAVKSMNETDKTNFYIVLDAGVEEQRMGKLKK